MYLRVSTVKRGSRTYRYAQLVESYRKPGGTSTNRVIASLGALDENTISNLKAALAAAREGKAVVVPDEGVARPISAQVLQNLRYLDIAVLLQLWNSLGMPALLRRELSDSDYEVPAEDIVTALVLQRCVAPGSKLSAQRWYPTTALPELQRIQANQVNNTRIHRVLADLERAEDALRDRLAGSVSAEEGGFKTFFIDATDAWYVGRGAPLAALGKDKEGVFRRRVGLVLLCDQRGYPLRWHTLSGKYHDGTALLAMARAVAGLDWVGDSPVVLDRAVGQAGSIEQLAAAGLHYVTAVPAPEFKSSGAPIPWEQVAGLHNVGAGEEARQHEEVATAAGFKRIQPGRYVLDLGLFDKERAKSSAVQSCARIAMEVVRIMTERPDESLGRLADELGCTQRSLQRYRTLCKLSADLQQRARSGEADGLNLSELSAIARLPQLEQAAAFHQAIQDHPPTRIIRARRHWKTLLPKLPVRGVLIFDARRAREQRERDEQAVEKIHALIAQINRGLASPRSRRSDSKAVSEVARLIRRRELGAVFDVRMVKLDGDRSVVLDRDDGAWDRRRQADGLTLLVAHPKVTGTADELVKLYFSKDTVEKDFQTMKSFIEFRPFRHQTDIKLKAHVTICVLALLLVRLLGERLARCPVPCTAPAALEILETVHLNRIKQDDTSMYSVTVPDKTQRTILKHLGMEALSNDPQIASTIAAR